MKKNSLWYAISNNYILLALLRNKIFTSKTMFIVMLLDKEKCSVIFYGIKSEVFKSVYLSWVRDFFKCSKRDFVDMVI